MAKIKLTHGKYTLVDDDMLEELSQYTWWLHTGYAYTKVGGRKNPKGIFMHRLVNKTPDDKITDHINRDTLDNRRVNLRSVNKSQNALNSKLHVKNKTGHKGVHWDKARNKWASRIMIDNKEYYIGRFSNLGDAVKARIRAEEKLIAGELQVQNGIPK